MPLTVPKQHTNTGKTVGAAVLAGEYDALLGTNPPLYGDDAGNVVVTVESLVATTSAMLIDNTANDTMRMQMTFDFKLTGLPSQASVICEMRNSTAKIGTVLINLSAGNATVLVRNRLDTGLVGWTSGVAIALNTWYRVQVALEVGTTTTGKMKGRLIRLFDAVTMATGESTNLDLGTTSPHHYQIGKNALAGTIPLRLDNIVLWDSVYDYVATATEPPGAQAASTIGIAIIDATASTPGSGGSLTYSITPIGGAPAPTLRSAGIWTVAQSPDGPLSYTVTVTESGASASDVSVVVPTWLPGDAGGHLESLVRTAGVFV